MEAGGRATQETKPRDADAERPGMGLPRVSETYIAQNAIRYKYTELQ